MSETSAQTLTEKLFRLFLIICAGWTYIVAGGAAAAEPGPKLDPLDHLAEQVAKRVSLSGVENEWLASGTTVRFRVAENPPYHFDTQAPKGISVDYAKLVCKAFTIRCEFIPFAGGTFSESLDNIGSGNGVDVILSARRSPERERQALLTNEYLFSPQVILSRTGSENYFGVEDLGGRTVVVEKGFLSAQWLRESVAGIRFVEVVSTPVALQTLADGQGDAYVGDLTTTTYLIEQLGLSNLKIAAPTGFPIQGESMMVRKDWGALASVIDKAVAAMTAQERQSLRNRWVAIQHDHVVSRSFAIGVSATALVLLAVLGLVWRWNWLLKKEVIARKLAESTLQRSMSMMDRTQEIAQLGSWEWDVSTDTITWSEELYRVVQRNPAEGTPDYAGQLRMYAPQDGVRLSAAVEAAVTHGTSYALELEIHRGDGQKRTGLATGYAEKDTQGKVTRLFGYLQDITERKRAENIVEQYRRVVQASLDGFWITDITGSILEVNTSVCRVLGYTREELLTLYISDIEADETPEETALHTREMMESGHTQFEARHRRKDGAIINVEVSVLHLPDLNDRFFAFVRDITARKEAEQQLRVAATAFEAQEGMLVTDANNTILRVNGAFTTITGYSSVEAVGKTPSLLKSGRHDASFYTHMWECLHQDGAWQGEIWNRRKNGDAYPEWLTVTVVTEGAGTVTHYVATMTDITQRKIAEDEIYTLAFYDPLTKLPNRRLMFDRLHQALTSSERRHRHGALIMLDLDNFKTLNDTEGHDVGDRLLMEVAARLHTGVREGDTVARLGGDEFVVILEDLDQETFAVTQAEAVALKIQSLLNEPYVLTLGSQRTSHGHYCTCSMGITLFQGQQVSCDELMKRADTAMYQAKAAGRNALRFFDPDMQKVVTQRAELEVDLRRAIANHEFVLYYQAQVDSAGHIVGAEALVRWQHPQRGLVLPGEFIVLAEETGLILPLGHWVMEAACQQLNRWSMDAATAHLTVAVNVSARQFRMPDFVTKVLSLVDQTEILPQHLKLELTESMLLETAPDIIEKMAVLKARGISFSLDDFGTGYSSLSYLKALPLDQLKIDQSFVRDIMVDPNDAAIARTIVALAHNLGLSVIAEGVESEGQRDFLLASGCTMYQGYLFGRPVPVQDLERMFLHS